MYFNFLKIFICWRYQITKIHIIISILGNQNVEGGMPGPSHGSTELNQEQQGESKFIISW